MILPCFQSSFACSIRSFRLETKIPPDDGEIYVYDAQGKFIKEIKTPERPTSIVISNDDKTLYITSAGSLYSKNLQ